MRSYFILLERMTRLDYILLKAKLLNRSVEPSRSTVHRTVEFNLSRQERLEKKMERVTRLELATSTLARWRSTG